LLNRHAGVVGTASFLAAWPTKITIIYPRVKKVSRNRGYVIAHSAPLRNSLPLICHLGRLVSRTPFQLSKFNISLPQGQCLVTLDGSHIYGFARLRNCFPQRRSSRFLLNKWSICLYKFALSSSLRNVCLQKFCFRKREVHLEL
jgi:hypothetical protein